MFSGGDSSEGINSLNQLGAYGFVNQVAVTNAMAAGQNIDWAQLAQQWIQMRDNSAMETKMGSNASNADNVSAPSCNNLKFEEKGEADMDMDDEEQIDEKTALRTNNEFASSSATHSNLNQPWFFSEGTSQIAPRSVNNSQWNAWPNREIMIESNKHVNVSNRPSNPTAHIPSLLKMTVPHPNEIRVMPDTLTQAENNTTSMMDAAKRKGLPAWIREGLEKMEREKLKQLEREQQKKDNTNSSDEDNVSDKNMLSKSLNPSSNSGKFVVLDEESTDGEDLIITKNTNNDETEEDFKKDNDEDDTLNSPVAKTYEQKMADLMIVVRRTLTELLLEATNEEISKVADETIKTFKSKASSAQVIRKSALSTLTGKLGLAAYGDSSSEDNSDDDDEHNSSKKATGQSESENDSEEEIRNIIRAKRRAFIKTSEEIEERVTSAAAREEEKLKYFSRKEEEEQREHNRKNQERTLSREPSSSSHSGNNIFKGYEKDFGEITETKIQNLNGKRQRERSNRRERTTRFSDNKDKYVALPNAAAFLTNMNTAANSGTVSNTAAPLSNNIQRHNLPDINGLLPNYTNTGMTNVLNAADAALEKVLKGKTSSSPEKQGHRHDRDRSYAPSKKRQRTSDGQKSRSRSKSSSSSSTSSSSTSSDSDSSSTSRSSHQSKYNHRSATKHKSHSSSDKHYEKPHKDHRGDRKYSSSSSSYRKKDRESSSRRYHRNRSSDSEDEYRRRHKYDSHYSRNSSHSRSYTSSRRDRDREHSRSQSRSSYSSSSNRRQ